MYSTWLLASHISNSFTLLHLWWEDKFKVSNSLILGLPYPVLVVQMIHPSNRITTTRTMNSSLLHSGVAMRLLIHHQLWPHHQSTTPTILGITFSSRLDIMILKRLLLPVFIQASVMGMIHSSPIMLRMIRDSTISHFANRGYFRRRSIQCEYLLDDFEIRNVAKRCT